MPNALGVVIVNVTFQVADAILALSALGFLGFGVHYPNPTGVTSCPTAQLPATATGG
jgi:ABC-type dipeptide/oligopeptide/nickel transport system permease subunit